MGRLRYNLDFTRGLGFRLGALISVAILPLGLISLAQTLHLSKEAERSAEIALLGRTASAASGERALLQTALGTADALGPTVLELIDNPAACSDMMRAFVQRSATYVYAGFTPLSGLAHCTSSEARSDAPVDLRGSPIFQRFVAAPGTLMMAIPRGPVSGRQVVVVAQPLYRERELLGYIAVSLSQELLRSTHALNFGTEGARIMTFNSQGQILTNDQQNGDVAADLLPRGASMLDMLDRNETTFSALSSAGEQRVFAVVTVVPGLVYALGSWSPLNAGVAGFRMSRVTAIALPVALWIVSLAVAYFAVYRLVLRHIGELRGQMRRFAIGDRSSPPPVLTDAPAEISDVSQTFHNMARILIRDEEAMEAAVAEKTVLLKEVHHRVKNNLQLIASIINMQSRMIDHDDAKRVLRSVQDRVAALATIYRNLYQAEHLDAVDAHRLIGDIINHMANASAIPGAELRIETAIEPLTLLPDQAVPLSLLATEAFTNALKYAGPAPGEYQAWVRVALRATGPGEAELTIQNSTGPHAPLASEGTGLGSQLIEAFATQLEGEASTGTADHVFTTRLMFHVEHVPGGDEDDPRRVVFTSTPRAGATH